MGFKIINYSSLTVRVRCRLRPRVSCAIESAVSAANLSSVVLATRAPGLDLRDRVTCAVYEAAVSRGGPVLFRRLVPALDFRGWSRFVNFSPRKSADVLFGGAHGMSHSSSFPPPSPDTPLYELQERNAFQNSKYFSVHLSDALRLAILYKVREDKKHDQFRSNPFASLFMTAAKGKSNSILLFYRDDNKNKKIKNNNNNSNNKNMFSLL